MSIDKRVGIFVLALGVLSGCPTPQQDQVAGDYRVQATRGINAMGYNANGFNAAGYNASGINASGINAGGFNSSGFNAGGINAGGINAGGINSGGINSGGINSGGINGSGLVGTGVEGLTLTSATYTGGGLTNAVVTGLALNNSELLIAVGDKLFRGSSVEGLELHYSYQANATSAPVVYTIKFGASGLDPRAKLPQGQANDVWTYSLSWKLASAPADAAWQSWCQTETGSADRAILLANRWDSKTVNRVNQPSFVTFACHDWPLAKCTWMGYRPWANGTSCTGAGSQRKCTDISLADHHQSCVRMMIADYCGSGKSYTVNGTLIDIYDYLNPPINVPETDWDIEARWTPTGAICINEPRHPELVGKWRRPDCNGDGKPDDFPACGQSDNRYSGKGLVVDRYDDDQSGTKK